MVLWLDAQIAPSLAKWINEYFSITCLPVRDLGLLKAKDKEIYLKAKKEKAIVITKDSDFLELHSIYGSPPKIIWLTCGNTSNDALKEILQKSLLKAMILLNMKEDIVEISQ